MSPSRKTFFVQFIMFSEGVFFTWICEPTLCIFAICLQFEDPSRSLGTLFVKTEAFMEKGRPFDFVWMTLQRFFLFLGFPAVPKSKNKVNIWLCVLSSKQAPKTFPNSSKLPNTFQYRSETIPKQFRTSYSKVPRQFLNSSKQVQAQLRTSFKQVPKHFKHSSKTVQTKCSKDLTENEQVAVSKCTLTM